MTPVRDPQRDRTGRYSRGIVHRLRHFLFVRHGHNWLLLIRFGLVGGSGVLVNLLAVVVANKVGPPEQGVFFNLPLTDFNVRWYHVFSTIAFLVANIWNFQLNRRFTFKSAAHAGWGREYFPFLAVGLLGQVVGLAILTLLLHPGSVFSLSPTFFDDSSGFRTRLYWAQLIMIAVVTPVSFVLNKLWTFSSVRGVVKQPTFEQETLAEEREQQLAEQVEARRDAQPVPGPRTQSSGDQQVGGTPTR